MKISLKFMLLVVAMLMLGFSARAGGITEEQAKAIAQSFLQSRNAKSSTKRLVPARTPKELRSTPTGEATLYVFNVGDRDGFVIVSGDNRARSILGYADSGSFDAEQMPAALREMLAIYAQQINMLSQTDAKADSAARVHKAPRRISGTMSDVAPLLTTTWDQGDPYNAYCPTLNDQTALTGCVATAMAQIAYYHKYPTSQVPSLAAYTSSTNKINVSAWGATTFDWDNMLDNYSASYTNKQKVAVATLMRYCGQAAQMDYGFTSGAYNGDALYAFKEKLGYNANANFRSAASYSANGWEDLIYKEVHDGRPVYYSALNGDEGGAQCGGHAFVIDGYRADGNYFHVNWGWGGASDGYFNLFALDPNAPESAATATGWHYQMLAIVGLSPETVNTTKLVKDASGSWLITSAEDWNELSNNLEAYNGGSFKLTNDISVTTMVGTEEFPFSGTFDGQGHTLNVNIESDGWGAAPFSKVDYGTNIKNLKTTGTVNSSEYHCSSGLIGGIPECYNVVTITNCEVAVQVNGSEYGGGFIGHAGYAQPVFTDCIFSGSINGCWDRGCFVGWKEWSSRPVYVNCLSIPTSLGDDDGYSCDFSHPGNGGSTDDATFTNCYSYYANGFSLSQGETVTPDELADGSVAQKLQNGSRNWTDGQVWGQQIGTDAVPMLTSRGVYKVTFILDGQKLKSIYTNSPIGDKMPSGEDFGLTNATFTYNGAAFTSTTSFSSDITVTVTGTSAYTLTLGTPTNGSISINSNTCIPGFLKKITAIPASGYVVSAVTVIDATGKALPVTQVSNNANEYVFAFPKSSVTVNAVFIVGEPEAVHFINGGMTLPSSWRSSNQHWTADTWMIWGDEYDGTDNVIVGTPPADALGHKWYEEGYALTNSDADVLPNGNKIVWENHAASFKDGGNYDYFQESGAGWDDRNGDFYIRRIFTFNTQSVPTKLYMSCSYDDAPVEYYINGTLIYEDQKVESWYDENHEVKLTSEQIALIHTDGTPNVLAVHTSQNWGGYHLDCGLYDPTAISYEVTSESTVRVLQNAFMDGDVTIPATVTSNGVTYTVTAVENGAFSECYNLTSVVLPSTVISVGENVFEGCDNLQFVKSYVPIYQEQTLIAAPVDATTYELPMGYTAVHSNAFKFTDKLTTLTLPRSLTYIGENAFVGCTSLTDIYAYARPVPETDWDAFEGIDKSKITVHVYASALDSYKESWGEEFQYVTMSDPQPITLTIDVENVGTLGTLINEATEEKGSTIYDVVGITVTGNINNDDLRMLAAMCTGVYSLVTIDLGGAAINNNTIESYVFNDKEKLTSIILPKTLEYINERAFNGCQNLTSIDIPASVKRIYSYAFDNCPNLTTVTGCEGLIDTNAWEDWYVFGWTPNVKGDVYGGTTFLSLNKDATGEYEVPAGIKVIVGGAMHGRNITSVIIPSSVTDLGNDVFRGCHQLTDFYVYATTPPVCHDGSMEYDYDKGQATLHVPASALEAYHNADEWREFGHIVAMAIYDLTVNVATPGTFTATLASAMDEADISTIQAISQLNVNGGLNSADIEKMASIGSENSLIDIRSHYTVTNDDILIALDTLATSFNFDNSLNSIHDFAFAGCSELKDIYFTNTQRIPSLPTNAFGDEDKSKVTLHVYESYLNHFQSAWGEEFQYKTMDDPDNLIVIFTDEPLYLYNVDAGLYFAAGNAYGTQASLSTEPMEVTLENGPNGSYIIKTLNGSDELFMEGSSCYVDRSGRDLDYYWEFLPNSDGTYYIRMAASNTDGHIPSNYPGMYLGRSDLSETWISHMADINDANAQIRWQLMYLSEFVSTELAEGDYAALCAISNTLGGDSWTKKWDTNVRTVTKNAWPGVVVDDDGHVTAISLSDNNLTGDISLLTLSTLTELKSLNLSNNAITGDIKPLMESLPAGCTLNVEHQNLGYVGEFSLYELCNYGELPSIAYYRSETGTLASTLIGVKGVCQFYHEGTNGDYYWDGYIYADGSTHNNFKFYWPSPVTVECFQPHHFTFTYRYEMGDANMDDALNVLDLQTTLNYSNGQQWGLFNFYAADTYAQDDNINVQDIVATVNILLAQNDEDDGSQNVKRKTVNSKSSEAYISVENGEIVLYTTKPVASLDLRLGGIKPEFLSWNIEDIGFTTSTASQSNGTHAIIYSLNPQQIDEGRTVLATFDASLSPNLISVVLCDSKACLVNVGETLPTGISKQTGNILADWRLIDLSGLCVLAGTHSAMTDIIRQAKNSRLQGVFILEEQNGAKYKVVIK